MGQVDVFFCPWGPSHPGTLHEWRKIHERLHSTRYTATGRTVPPGEATSFHKIHSYWEDGSPRGSCRKPRAMWRGYGEVPMGRWTGLWRRGSVVALTFVFLLRWTPECTGGLGCQVVVDKELDEVWSWLKVWESRLKTRLKFWWLESRSPIATGMGRCGSSEPVMHLDIIRSGSEAIVVHCRIFIRSL